MRWVLESVMIFVTFLVFMLGVAWWQGRKPRVPLERLADPAPLPGELPHAGLMTYVCNRCGLPQRYCICPGGPENPWPLFLAVPSRVCVSRVAAEHGHAVPSANLGNGTGPYGPFLVDTGPLLLLSEKMAAVDALEREIPRLCDEAEAKIPPRWRR